jgi:Na+-transporting methylmalonyl-CoA/oxaloacetate decarboxylase gamma subunit
MNIPIVFWFLSVLLVFIIIIVSQINKRYEKLFANEYEWQDWFEENQQNLSGFEFFLQIILYGCVSLSVIHTFLYPIFCFVFFVIYLWVILIFVMEKPLRYRPTTLSFAVDQFGLFFSIVNIVVSTVIFVMMVFWTFT